MSAPPRMSRELKAWWRPLVTGMALAVAVATGLGGIVVQIDEQPMS